MSIVIRNNLGNHAGHKVEISKKPSHIQALEDSFLVREVMQAINEAYYKDSIPESLPAKDLKLA